MWKAKCEKVQKPWVLHLKHCSLIMCPTKSGVSGTGRAVKLVR